MPVVCVGALCGCTVRTAPAPQADPNAPGAAAPALVVEGPNIGDIEHGLSIEITVQESLAPEGVEVDELRSFTGALNLATGTVPPGADRLPALVSIAPRFNAGSRPVALRGTVLRDDDPIAAFELLVAPDGPRLLHVNGAPLPDLHFTVDALHGLGAVPETMLLHVSVDVHMLPADTDPDAVDVATVEAVPTARTTVLSNPLRVNRAPEAPAA